MSAVRTDTVGGTCDLTGRDDHALSEHGMRMADRPASWLPAPRARLGAFWPVWQRFPLIAGFLDAESVRPLEASWAGLDGIVGWGDRLQARLARGYAARRGLPYWTLEDGFFRSVGLGKSNAVPVSMIADDLGIHFSASQTSRLEQLLQTGNFEADLGRARDLRELIVRHRLTKYNHLPDRPALINLGRKPRILLIDQVQGDRSVAAAGADRYTFDAMWKAARARSDATLVIKSHPDVQAGFAKGFLSELARHSNACVVTQQISPHAVLDVVDEVWTVSSQLGFDALLRRIPVVTFGAPAYAGWGLTEDRADTPIAAAAFARRRRRLTLDEYVSASLLHYAIYLDPVAQRQTTAEVALERLIAWRKRALNLRGTYLCVGFSRHKRKAARLYLEGPHSKVAFAPVDASPRRLRAADHVVVWSSKVDADALARLAAQRPSLVRVEDGFLRSNGLGSQLVPPSSLCFDRSGIYFDATRISGLEDLLSNTEFDEALLARAARLTALILENGLTKYNLPDAAKPDYRRLAGVRPILVVAAQVPGDSSLRHGQPVFESNVQMLKAVRTARPDAFIVYKQHPDVLCGGRRGAACDLRVMHHANLVVGNVSVQHLLEAADEVHVATSQLGFEALMRGKKVHCYGLPFYAGWGLTDDKVLSWRRRRRLSLHELVAGALILYPTYVSWRTELPCEVEDVVRELAGSRIHLNANGKNRFWRMPGLAGAR